MNLLTRTTMRVLILCMALITPGVCFAQGQLSCQRVDMPVTERRPRVTGVS